MRGRDSEGGRERRNEGHGGIVGKGEREVLNCKCIPIELQYPIHPRSRRGKPMHKNTIEGSSFNHGDHQSPPNHR